MKHFTTKGTKGSENETHDVNFPLDFIFVLFVSFVSFVVTLFHSQQPNWRS